LPRKYFNFNKFVFTFINTAVSERDLVKTIHYEEKYILYFQRGCAKYNFGIVYAFRVNIPTIVKTMKTCEAGGVNVIYVCFFPLHDLAVRPKAVNT